MLPLPPDATVVDVTVGLGGHADALLRQLGPHGAFFGLDADSQNLESAKKRLSHATCKVTLLHRNFRDLPQLPLPRCNLLFADLGLSSPHVDDPARGFSFRNDGPLDLRFDRTQGRTAAELIADSSAEELARILFEYGEIRQSRTIAARFHVEKPSTTFAVRDCVQAVAGFRTKHVLPQVFQALRIAVNGELDALHVLLSAGPELLLPGGTMAVISYHSLEDRMVKHVFRRLSTPETDPDTGAVSVPATFTLPVRKAIKPGAEEVEANPRARSARLRLLQRIV